MERSKTKKEKSYVLPSIYKGCHWISTEDVGNGENANISFSELLRVVYLAFPLLRMFRDTKCSSPTEQTSRPKPKKWKSWVKRASQFYPTRSAGRHSVRKGFSSLLPFWLPSFPPQRLNIWKPNFQTAPMLCITSRKLVEVTWNQASSFLRGKTSSHIYKEQHGSEFQAGRRQQARLKSTKWGNKKDHVPEERAGDKAQNWPSPEQVGQSNKEDKNVTCYITLRLPC